MSAPATWRLPHLGATRELGVQYELNVRFLKKNDIPTMVYSTKSVQTPVALRCSYFCL